MGAYMVIIFLETWCMKLPRCCSIVLIAGSLAAQISPPSQVPPRPRYEVKNASSRIQVDGKLDEKAWQAATPIILIFPWESQTGAKQKTTVRLLWDDQKLYI